MNALIFKSIGGNIPLGGSMTNLGPECLVYGPQGRLSIN